MVAQNTHIKKGFETPPLSYWVASTTGTDYPSLQEDIKVDVAIVGGGLTGITSAFLLKQEGMKVAVIDADRIIQGTTAHTTAKVTSQHGLTYYKIKKQMGEENARQYAEANEYAIGFMEQLIKKKKIECDFHSTFACVYTHQDDYIKKIEDEAKTAAELGIKASYRDSLPLPFKIKAAVYFDNQARFHPRKYLLALAKDIPGDGSHIFEQTKAVDIEEGSTCAVVTDSGKKVQASGIIIASHYPFYDKPGLYFTRLYPERSYALGVKIRDKYPGGMYITAEDPGRSLRNQEFNGGELIILSGEHHKTGQGGNTESHYENLMDFAYETFDVEDVLYRWSTQDYTTADEIPYIGRLTSGTPNIYVATGYRKWGMTTSTVSGIILRDLITKGKSPWESVYNPSRFTPIASARNFIVENTNVAQQLIGGKLKAVPEDIDIQPGDGRIIEVDGQKTGAYRDEKGKLHLVDTTCTHLGCEVQWNAAERTWDCPCHGSRYTYEGDIVEGPALKAIRKDKG